MRSVGLYHQLAKDKYLRVNGVLRPGPASRTPVCRKCGNYVDYVAIEDRGPDPDYPSWFDVRVKCRHGDFRPNARIYEDYQRVECRSRMKPDLWSTVVATGSFFDPSHEDSGMSRPIK